MAPATLAALGVLASALHAGTSGTLWQRGTYGVLSFEAGCRAYNFTFGGTTLTSAPTPGTTGN